MATTEDVDFKRLSTNEWEQLAEIAQHHGPCILSLEDIRAAHPSGIIALTLTAHFRSGQYTNVILPSRQSRSARYLDRINFIRMANRFGVRFDRTVEVELRQRHRAASSFTKILSLDDPDYKRAQKIIREHFQQHFAEIFTRLWIAFTEVLINIDHHSGGKEGDYADHIIQVHGFNDRLELAFGDLGVGFLRSLQRNPKYRTLDSEQNALSKVVHNGASRLSHRPKYKDRGGGLRKALDAVHELGGGFRLVSGDGTISRMAGQWDQFHLETMRKPFPGTLMAIQIPFE